jgi:hypothetical protein
VDVLAHHALQDPGLPRVRFECEDECH